MAETIAINVAYALYFASGLVKTVVRLRLFLIAVSLAFITWAALAEVWSAVAWNAATTVVHIYQLVRLWAHRRSIVLTKQETAAHHRLFGDLDLIDFFTLWSIGTARTLLPNTVLVTEGQVQQSVMLIMDGEAVVERGGERLATLDPDCLIGERSYMTGDAASATVQTTTEVTVHEWDQRKMSALIDLCPAAHESMIRFIGADLAKKL